MYESKNRIVCRILAAAVFAAGAIALVSCGGGNAPATPTPTPTPSAVPTSAPERTPSPTQTPTQIPTQTLTPTPTALPAEAPDVSPSAVISVEDYFNGAVFIGDSIQEGIAQYVRAQRSNGSLLGDATFVATTIGIRLADFAKDTGADARYLSYKGTEKPVEEIIGETGADRVFLLMGMNDMAQGYEISDSIDCYSRAIDIILAANPGVEVVVELNTPKVASSWLPWYCLNRDFNNAFIDGFVAQLRDMCTDKGVEYVDLNTVLKNEGGALPDDYSNDGYVHINSTGSKVVIKALYDFAALQIGGS
ncbi:MAG: GDSL-type esterase/lipase family protein [Oscillospiraceae bacterium]|jgi:lysophospholipase L1-like esterase|nr:GDSL-type esterase/lipase family protein [Oscillospiraceae bacterium]